MFTQVHIFIHGKVTGVFFRAWAKEKADLLGVKGWIRNVYDNKQRFGEEPGVEAVLQGEKEVVDKMIDFCKKGPPNAQVAKVEIHNEDPQETYFSFDVHR